LEFKDKSFLIAGCGYVGTALGERLLREGGEVWGICRQEASIKKLEEKNIRPFKADLSSKKTLENLPRVTHVVACQAPEGPQDTHDKVYYEGTKNLLESLHRKEIEKFIFVSSTSVYGDRKDSWVDESAPLEKEHTVTGKLSPQAECLIQTERLVLKSGVPSMILRLGGIYGPGRNRLKRILEGSFVPSFSQDYTNRIHRDDIVSTLLLLLKKGSVGEVYLGVDDEPVTQEVFYSWIYERLGRAKLSVDQPFTAKPRGSKRCSNKKLKSLGFSLLYPTYRQGYEELIQEVLRDFAR